jgi:DNA-binding SARP family transcriptional activator
LSQPDPPVPVTLRLLGLAAWRVGAGAWQPLSRKDAALLARLALQGPQSRSAMAAWLWPGVPLPRAHANLRQRLFRQRRHAAALVEEEGAGLRLRGHVQCDVHGADGTDAASLATPLLAGLPDAEDEVQHWLDQARQQWAARRLDLLAGRAAQQQGRGELAAALASTEALLALDPLLEHGWRRLMRLHHARGDRAAAVAAFERCERVLRDELSLKPAPENRGPAGRGRGHGRHRAATALATAAQFAAASPAGGTAGRPDAPVGRMAGWAEFCGGG